MSKLSLGIVETVGLAAGIEAADAAVKSANVELLGYELTKGSGMVTIKLVGDVGAVKAAVDAACVAASKITSVYSQKVIARPHEEIEKLIYSRETVGLKREEETPSQQEEVSEEKPVEETEEIVDTVDTVDEKPEEDSVDEEDTEPEDKQDVEVAKEDEIEVQTDIQDGLEKETTEEDSDVEKKNKEIEDEAKIEHEEVLKIEKTPEELCNYCKDPACPRKKGELRNTCIHYDKL